MSNVYFAADLHIGHKNIANFRTQFSSQEEHDAVVMDNLLSTVTKRDKLYLLGDIAFTFDALELIKKIPCQKVLVCGNHDLERGITMKHLVDVYDEVTCLAKYKHYWLSHCPIHPMEMRGRKGNIHGHLHYAKVPDDQYFCVSLEHTGYKPITFDEVLERSFEVRPLSVSTGMLENCTQTAV